MVTVGVGGVHPEGGGEPAGERGPVVGDPHLLQAHDVRRFRRQHLRDGGLSLFQGPLRPQRFHVRIRGTRPSWHAGGVAERDDLTLVDAWWRAANYLAVGQIYLLDNPLLRQPLQPEHIKPRLLGHWGTTPGLNLIYSPPQPRHPPSASRRRLRRWAPATAARPPSPTPGSRAPGPRCTRTSARDEPGMHRLFRQFSFPGGVPSHVAPEMPGSIHEGGELGYACPTPTARRSTTPISSWPASSATARPRRGRWRPAGTATSSSTRPRRRRAAHPPPQRLQDRQPDGAGPHPRARAGAPARGLRPRGARRGRRRARRRPPPAARRPSTPRSTTSPRSSGAGARTASGSGRGGR